MEVLDGTTGLDEALDVAFRIEASGWKGRGGTAVAARPADERYHRLLAGWAARRGWFRLAFLRLDGRAIAFHYSLQAHGVLYALKIGFADDMGPRLPRQGADGLRDRAGVRRGPAALRLRRERGRLQDALGQRIAHPRWSCRRSRPRRGAGPPTRPPWPARASPPAAKRCRAALRSARVRARARLSGG